MFHRHNVSSHLDKTSAYGVRVIHYDNVPRNLSNMDQEFHLQICKGWSLLCIWVLWFFVMHNIELKNWVGNVQYTTSRQHKYFPSIPSHLKIPKATTYLELKGGCCMCTLSIILGSIVKIVTCGWEKFTWSGWWESLLALGGQSIGRLEAPQTSSPSRCSRRFVKDDPNV
jgi:hypothetical protein